VGQHAELRYLVLPERPVAAMDGLRKKLAALVTRDAIDRRCKRFAMAAHQETMYEWRA